MIEPTALHQADVVTRFDHAAILEYQDAIRLAHGGEPVGDDQCGALLEETGQRLVQASLSVSLSSAEVASSRITTLG